jgi:hypothetical protein
MLHEVYMLCSVGQLDRLGHPRSISGKGKKFSLLKNAQTGYSALPNAYSTLFIKFNLSTPRQAVFCNWSEIGETEGCAKLNGRMQSVCGASDTPTCMMQNVAITRQ